MIKKLFEYFKTQLNYQRDYFTFMKDDISINNSLSLRNSAIAGSFLFLVICIYTPLIIPTWHISGWYLLMVPFLIGYMILGLYLVQKKTTNYRLIQGICISFYVLMSILVMNICVFPYPDEMSPIYPYLLIAIAMIFSFPYWLNAGLIVLLSAFYCMMVVHFKNPAIVYQDLFSTVTAAVVALILEWMVGNLKVHDDLNRLRYKRLSSTDVLTGILNKSSGEEQAIRYMNTRGSEYCVMLVLDIDNFKAVNDTYGHQTGDIVLAELGNAMNSAFRGSDIRCRIGGDEFMVIMKDILDLDVVRRKVNLFSSLFSSHVKESQGFDVNCSIGGILCAPDMTDYKLTCSKADRLLYKCKRQGKANHVITTEEVYQGYHLDQMTMLIADDEEASLAILSGLFEKDYRILTAKDGEEALQILMDETKNVDILLLDLIMPKMDGKEVIRKLKNDPKTSRIPVVIISADEQSELTMLEMGVDEMIRKPFDLSVAKERVNKVIRNYNKVSKE